MSPPSFPALLQRFFTERLVTHLDASGHTVAAYRDTFRVLLPFVHARVGRAPSALRLDDLDASCLEAFLVHLERDRHNQPRTRNQRLAALRGFFRYVALGSPATVCTASGCSRFPRNDARVDPWRFSPTLR
jgi:site-specific recombinase XerD